MIFVTTGTQAPFNRLVRAMDIIANDLRDEEIIVQAFGVDFETKNLKIIAFLNPVEYDEIFSRAKLIVSHAGMGSIVSALTKDKPIIVIPRKAILGEHRNDHQMEGAKKLESLGYIPVAYDEHELKVKIMEMLSIATTSGTTIGHYASGTLMDSIRFFILNS